MDFKVVKQRTDPQEALNCYLFERGLINMKKCGGGMQRYYHCAKKHDNEELANEICDLTYPLLVLMRSKPAVEQVGPFWGRRQKIVNKTVPSK